MANGFETWLQKVGKDLATGATFFVQHILPVASAALTAATPILTLVLPAEGPIFAKVASLIAQAEEKFPASGTGAQKLAWVQQEASSLLLPLLTKAGVSENTEAIIQNYLNAIVALLNGPTATTPAA